MKNTMTALAAISLVMGTVACSDSTDDTEATASDGTISGEWLADASSAEFENDTRDYVLADGTFDCRSCTPPYQVAADGEWQTVDRPGVDSMMVETVVDSTVRAAFRLGDADLGSSTYTVGEDGETVTLAFVDTSGTEEVTGSGVEISDTGLRFSYSLEGDQYTSMGNGQSFTATLGGDPVAIEGSNSNVMVAV